MSQRLRSFAFHSAVTLAVIAAALVAISRFGGAELALGNLVLRAQRGTAFDLAPPRDAANTTGLEGAAPLPPPEGRPKNVILFIGDGMGVGHVSAAEILLQGPGGGLVMTSFESLGLMRTWAADNLVTDSAASGTAIATGFKTDCAKVGMRPDGRPTTNLFEAAREGGMATGLITTSGLVDATPACFTAHVDHRDRYDVILEQMLDSKTDLMLGGDWSADRKAKRNSRFMEMIAAAEDLGRERGYTVVRSEAAMAGAQAPLLGLFPPRPGGGADHGPRLSRSLHKALEVLGRDPDGYVIVVEAETTDKGGHDNDVARTTAGVAELDEAVALARALTGARGDTLLVVTADHDTGSLSLIDGEYASGRAVVRWASAKHSAQMVPVFASGPGAESFAGVLDNTELGRRIAGLLGLGRLDQLAETPSN